jgi:putative transposase
VRFRWSRAVPPGVKSYRVTMDRAGRWHVAFAVIPEPIAGPGNGQTVGRRQRLRRLQRRLARARPGSNRRARVKLAMARLRAREADARKDWAEKASTGIARRFDLIRVEDLQIRNMTRSAKGTAGNPGRNVRQKAGLRFRLQG